MIITYQKSGCQYNCFAVVPESVSWRLETAVEAVVDATQEDPGYFNYALNLVVGRETVDCILLAEELWGVAPEDEEDEAILALMNRIIELAACETAEVICARGQILDLGTIIRDEVEFWCKFQEACKKA